MNHSEHSESVVHQQLTLLIPWYVNGTLGEDDCVKLEAHLAGCVQCREDLALERQIHGSIGAQDAVEYMPAASLKKLMGKIEGAQESGLNIAPAPAALARMPRRRMRRLRWHGLTAASAAVMALAISALAVDRIMQNRSATSAQFYTVTKSTPRPSDEVIRAVFVPNITLVELQALLDEAKLRIISGPTEAGVYSLAATSSRPVNTSLALLRQHEGVRFAESTKPAAGSDATP